MNRRTVSVVFILLILAAPIAAQRPDGAMAFTVSMDKPSTHYFHVEFRCENIRGATLDFKLPVWTPGYYWIMNFPKNVTNFRVADAAGKSLPWEKTTKNCWRVQTGNAQSVVVRYDVYAFTQSVADPYLDDTRAYISPTAVFMHIDGKIRHPVVVTIKLPKEFSTISTGLDPVPGQQNMFTAPDFDALYDSPLYIGNQTLASFTVQGVPHSVAFENVANFEKENLIADLQRIVDTGANIIGEIPYRLYTFMIMGPGGGGLEHRNSTAVFSGSRPVQRSSPGYTNWLAFLAHEYFHLYNVKSIRPIALGPFDYDKENYTTMLWVSEGFTVYYEYIILNRAGLLSRDDYFERIKRSIANYENSPGRLFQSAAAASLDSWIQFFNRSENTGNTTVSYYDKGCVLGMLFDLKIRHETKNKKSLDDVMRTLYQEFYKKKERGFTDEEFRATCEAIAGTSLAELFEYANTVKEIDYPKYFGYAGLEIDVKPEEMPGASLGVGASERDGKLVVGSVEWDSPAWHGGISARDTLLTFDNLPATLNSLNEMLSVRKPGDTLRILLARRDARKEVSISLGKKTVRSFRISPAANPLLLQKEILNSWMGN